MSSAESSDRMTASRRWYDKQLRIVQTVLREPDITGYDAEAVTEYLDDVRANCIVVNSGGVVDFFRHEMFSFNPNPFLSDGQDILADLTRACHRRDIKVIARVDFRGVSKELYDCRPDWFAADADGRPVTKPYDPPARPDVYAACYQSPYHKEYTYEYIRHLLGRYPLDGIWENGYNQSIVCYCRYCQLAFYGRYGTEIPKCDFASAAFDEYRSWRVASTTAHFRDMRAVVKEFGEDKAYTAEVFGLFREGYRTFGHDLNAIKDSFDFLVTPLFLGAEFPVDAAGTVTRFLSALAPQKTPVVLFGHLGYNGGLRYVSAPPAETRIWMWQTVANGGSLWDTSFNGQHPGATHDRRNARIVRDVFGFQERNEALLNGQAQLAEVDLLYSRATNIHFGTGPDGGNAYLDHLIGLEQVLLDNHVQYRIVLDDVLTPATLATTRVLLIPNAACMAETTMDVIRGFVRAGGQVLATYETSMYTPSGTNRGDFGLSDVFGCTFTGVRQDASFCGYQYVNGRHPITESFAGTEVIANWGENLLVRAIDGASARMPLTFVPKIAPQPPERSWLPSLRTDFPTLLEHDYHEGRAILLPNRGDQNVWRQGHPDFSAVLLNSVRHLLGGPPFVTSSAPGLIRIMVSRAVEPGRYLVHLVNVAGSSRRPLTHPAVLKDVEVVVGLDTRSIGEVTVLYGDMAISAVACPDSSGLRIHVPRLAEYACIALRGG